MQSKSIGWKLDSLRLNSNRDYTNDCDVVTGTALFTCDSTRTEIKLNNVQITAVLQSCAESLVADAQAKMALFLESAKELSSNLIEDRTKRIDKTDA